ncbi:unnamed protein product [Adineta ricciae]|uniref:Protein FAM227B n=1 Tax=Adineta ricciae TaxID=249248 RepID=A0A813WX42_ADIRI|nr:unnamed protein product [Adineta ricciae]
MVDIARVFSPVVVLESGEARPKSSDRIRSASAKRISSAGTRRTPPCVSSSVSTVEINNQVVSRYATNVVTGEKDFENELKKELATPLTGINLRELINEKISKLDRALREVGASYDVNQKKQSLISQKLRENAIRNGQSRQQMQEFVGLLATKAASENPVNTIAHLDENEDDEFGQDRSTLLEIFKYPGFHEDHVTPLPFHMVLETEVMRHILSKQYTLGKQAPYIKPLIQLYHSPQTKALILDIFWWIFLDSYHNQPEIQKKLLARASNNYVSLLMTDVDLRYRDKCFQVYPSLLAETVFACFKVCFPTSIKRLPADADAANKAKKESENRVSDLPKSPDTSDKSTKELVNLDQFKNSIANVCQLWLGGIPAPPRRYEQWRSKLVQQEKISFVEPTPVANSTIHDHNLHDNTENMHQISPERRKGKEPHERLRELYRTTNDPLPDRRVLFEDYRFNMNGNSPLTEKYLRSRHMLRKAGTQFFISHPQINQVPTVEAETYGKEIKRTAQFCRIVRAQKHKKRDEDDHHRKLIREHVVKLRAQDEWKKKEKQISLCRRKLMNQLNDDIEIRSQSSVKSHE